MYNSEFGRRLRTHSSGSGVGASSSSSSSAGGTAGSSNAGPSPTKAAAAASLLSSPSRSRGGVHGRAGSVGASSPRMAASIDRHRDRDAVPSAFDLSGTSWDGFSRANGSSSSLLDADLDVGTSRRTAPGAYIDANGASSSRRGSSASLVEGGTSSSMPKRGSFASIERPRTPGKSRVVQSTGDRYIPTRDGSDLQAAYQLMNEEPTTPSRNKRKMASDMDAQQEEANATFTNLLSSEIFGSSTLVSGPSRSGSSSHAASSASSVHSSGGSAARHGSSLTGVPVSPATPTKKSLFSYNGGKSPTASPRSPSTPKLGGVAAALSRNAHLMSGGTRSSGTSGGLFGGLSTSTQMESLDSPHHSAYSTSPVKQESQRMLLSPRKTPRTLSKVPFKVLDAPDLADDFYLNLVDWSSKDVMGVGLGQCVYLWSAKDSEVTKLCDLSETNDRITSLNWAGRGTHIAVGTSRGQVQIWDAEAVKLVRTMTGHDMRVGALAWNEHILTSGSRDRRIYHRDVRSPEHFIQELKGHRQEVCGLKWSTTSNQLASGGNDNKLLIWDGLHSTPLHRFTDHTAAVKAIAWSPHTQGLLASGGGTQDMKLRFWNTISGQLLSTVDTGSQVCNLVWSKSSNEVISTHGFSSGRVQNQIQVWRYPTMQQIATLTGHTMRVLYLAMSPDGETIVSGAGDETLRFWDLNTPSKSLLDRRRETGVGLSASASTSASSLPTFSNLR